MKKNDYIYTVSSFLFIFYLCAERKRGHSVAELSPVLVHETNLAYASVMIHSEATMRTRVHVFRGNASPHVFKAQRRFQDEDVLA